MVYFAMSLRLFGVVFCGALVFHEDKVVYSGACGAIFSEVKAILRLHTEQKCLFIIYACDSLHGWLVLV